MNVKHFLLLFVFCFSIAGHSQNVSLELVYLQTDKGIYETGEDFWFKTYTLDAQSLALSDRSKTLFVEMLNAKDSIVWQEKYPILSGIAEGHVYVDKDLKEGDYRIHAYTRFSFLNDTLRPVYPKKIRVIKSIAYKGTNSPQEKDQPVARLSFFPEGGYLIDGIPTKVAFKALDEKGMPAKVKGVLLENGKDIAKLESVHDGMGFVFILPIKGASYKAVLSDGREFPFAEVVSSGLSVHLRKQTDEYLEFLLSQPERGCGAGNQAGRQNARRALLHGDRHLEREIENPNPIERVSDAGHCRVYFIQYRRSANGGTLGVYPSRTEIAHRIEHGQCALLYPWQGQAKRKGNG